MEKDIEERVSTLEVTLGQFIVQTGKMMNRLSQEMLEYRKEKERDREETNKRMDRLSEEATRDREKIDETLTRFSEEAARDREETNKRMDRFSQQAERDREEMNKTMTHLSEKMLSYREEGERSREEMNKTMTHLSEKMLSYREEGERSREKMDKFIEEMQRDRKALNKQWGELANKMGTLAEDIAAPNVREIAQEYFGCADIDSYGVRIMRRNRNNRKIIQEFDVVLSCDNYLFINETKSTVQISYIDAFRAKLDSIFDYFPEHEGKQVVPIFSSLSLQEKHIDYLTDNKILAMAMGEETMRVYNLEILLADLR